MPARDQIGLSGPEYEVDIERGKIREFARAMSAPLPEFVDDRNAVIPAMFLVSAPYTWGYTLERPRGTALAQIDHDLSISLHAEEAFEFYGVLPRAGDRLIASGRLENVTEKSGANGGELTFLTFTTQYRDIDGTLRAIQRSTSVTTGQAPGSGNWQTELPEYRPEYASLERSSPFAHIARADLAELEAGAGPGPVTCGPLMQHDIVRFQGVVGEDDPLHYDMAWAKAQNYPSTFGLGTHQASLMAAYAAYWLEPAAVRSFRVRFRDIVWPGDVLVYDGQATHVDTTRMQAQVHLTCKTTDAVASGRTVSEAWMTLDFTQQQEGDAQ